MMLIMLKLIQMKSKSGFTIVELLIVIVVIAILAAISIVAYNGIQTRARDTQRANDISVLVKALEIYRVNNGQYPTATPAGSDGGWESSWADPNFMEYLDISKKPTDPTNTSTYRYRYYKYPAGYQGCDAAKGGYYVLTAQFENAASKPVGKSLNCPSYVLTDSGTSYYMAKFDNE